MLIELTNKTQTMEGEIGLLRQIGAKARDREREQSIKMNNLKERLELEEITCEAITRNYVQCKETMKISRAERNMKELSMRIVNPEATLPRSKIEEKEEVNKGVVCDRDNVMAHQPKDVKEVNRNKNLLSSSPKNIVTPKESNKASVIMREWYHLGCEI